MTKKEKWRYESWSTNRPTQSLEEKRKIRIRMGKKEVAREQLNAQ